MAEETEDHVPARQLVQDEAPDPDHEPALQAEQVAIDVAPAALDVVPAGQEMQEAEPTPE